MRKKFSMRKLIVSLAALAAAAPGAALAATADEAGISAAGAKP